MSDHIVFEGPLGERHLLGNRWELAVRFRDSAGLAVDMEICSGLPAKLTVGSSQRRPSQAFDSTVIVDNAYRGLDWLTARLGWSSFWANAVVDGVGLRPLACSKISVPNDREDLRHLSLAVSAEVRTNCGSERVIIVVSEFSTIATTWTPSFMQGSPLRFDGSVFVLEGALIGCVPCHVLTNAGLLTGDFSDLSHFAGFFEGPWISDRWRSAYPALAAIHSLEQLLDRSEYREWMDELSDLICRD